MSALDAKGKGGGAVERERVELQLATSKFSSLVGTSIFNVFINVWVIDTFGSARVLSHVLSIAGVSSLLFSFLGATISKKLYFIKAIRYADGLSAIFCLIADVLLLTTNYRLPILLALVFTLNMNVAMTGPSLKRLIGIAVSKDRIIGFNAVISTGTETIKVVMPMLTTFLYTNHWLSLIGTITLNGISFFISFLFIRGIWCESESLSDGNGVTYKSAFVYMLKAPLLAYLIIAGFFSNIFLSGYTLIIPTIAINNFHDHSLYGLIVSIESAAAILGLLSIRYIHIDEQISRERWGLIVGGLSVGVTGIFLTKEAFMLTSFILGFFYARYNVGLQSYIQINVRNELIGYFFSMIFICASIAVPIGSTLFGLIIDKHAIEALAIISAGITVINAIWFVLISRR
jgi:hypothetical protein